MKDLASFVRGHRAQLIMLSGGVALFAAGLINTFLVHHTADQPSLVHPKPSVSPVVSNQAKVGPRPGEARSDYVARKQTLLRSKAAGDPNSSTLACLSFAAYSRAGRATDLMKLIKAKPISVQVRVPIEGFEVTDLPLDGRTIRSVVDDFRKTKGAELAQEAAELEKLIQDVSDPEYKNVYETDAKRDRKASDVLSSDASIIVAIVLQGTYKNLSAALALEGVALIDVPEVLASSSGQFQGLLPEEVQ